MTSYKPQRAKHVAYTKLVLDALREQDDFLTAKDLVERTKATRDQVSAALHHLRKVRAIDAIVEPDGVGWWYALPENMDRRTLTYDEVTDHVKTRRKSRAKVMT